MNADERKKELKELEEKINRKTKDFVEFGKSELALREDMISDQYREFYSESLNYIRNLNVVSGAIAPFSLVLLQISSLDLYKGFLILGFVLLLINILYMQYIMFSDLYSKDKNIVKAWLCHFFADSDLRNMEEKGCSESVDAMFDYIKHSEESERYLQANKAYFNEETIRNQSTIRRHLKISFWVLVIAVLAIVGSVVLPQVMDTIELLMSLINSYV